MEKIKICLPGKDVFKIRIIKDNELIGCLIYDIVICFLELVGEEIKEQTTYLQSYQLGWYTGGSNGKEESRYFIITEAELHFIHTLIRTNLIHTVEQYGAEQMQKGSDLLFQLNNGKLTIDDFNKKLE